ncbi:heavy metal sensor histidine kinase [Orbus sturtevantii]|uniref:heavy metal sensor histidine kinase n=1 Tax=Orbus sturtevantii TaxID=3074109 RepID=UPI00370D3919
MLSQKKNYSSKLSSLTVIKMPLIVCLSTCALLYTLSYFIENSFEKYTVSQNIVELNSVIDSVERELSYYDSNKGRNELIPNILLILTSHSQLFIDISDEKNNTVYKTRGPDLPQIIKKINIDEIITNDSTTVWNSGHHSYQIGAAKAVTADNKEYRIIVAISRNLQLEFNQRLHNGLLMLIMIACIIVPLGTLYTTYLTQKPINRLIKKISSINAKSLNERIPRSFVPNKYSSLVDAFNEMISRMDSIFQRQHDFTADIAHEMRTPITNLTTQTQIALSSARTAVEYKEILYSNLEEFERLSQIITDMLFLAQADNKQLIPQLTEINLASVYITMFDYYEYLSEEKNITLKLEGHCPPILGDHLMIRRAISNLLSNAIRHTQNGGTITVTLSRINNKFVKVVTSNPGKVIEAKHLPLLFDRFYRTDESRQRNNEGTTGTGIGLAIVKSIVEAHKGEITVESDTNSTRLIMLFPILLKNKKLS